MIVKFIFLFLLAGSAIFFVIIAIRFLLKKVEFPAHHISEPNNKEEKSENTTDTDS